MAEMASLLGLQPHPEGGYYRETYRSTFIISREALQPVFPGERSVSTAIYFLLGEGAFSAFHRIRSDEVWHYYRGAPLHVHVIRPDGTYQLIKLGIEPDGYEPQAVVQAGSWFASECADPASWSLVGCTVAPGFEFDDFELAKPEVLAGEFPQHASLIRRLCRD